MQQSLQLNDESFLGHTLHPNNSAVILETLCFLIQWYRELLQLSESTLGKLLSLKLVELLLLPFSPLKRCIEFGRLFEEEVVNVKNLKNRIHSGTLSASRIRFQNVILFISLEMAMVQRLRTSLSVELWLILAQSDKISFWTYVFQNHFVGIIFMIILEEKNRNIIKLCLVLYSTFIVTKVEVRRACFTLPYWSLENVRVCERCATIQISK